MNTPNPLIPQGSLDRKSKGKSTVRIAILTIVSIHAVFFAGLLMQGCRRDDTKGNVRTADATNQNALPSLEGTSTFYSSTNVPEAAPTSNQPPPTANIAPEKTVTEQIVTPPSSVTEPSADGKAYKITKGDTLAKIAKANGVSLHALTKANPNVEPSKLKVGQTIQIPAGTSSTAQIGFTEPGKSESNATTGAGNLHTVKAGETLTKIAKQHGTTPKAIRAANNLKTDRLLVGQKLKLPATSPTTASSDATKASAVSKMTATNPAYVIPIPSTEPTTVR